MPGRTRPFRGDRTLPPEGDQETDTTRAVTSLVDPVGLAEIAARLGVARDTVDQWRQRRVLPASDATIGGRPAWSWSTIRDWAVRTGRQPVDPTTITATVSRSDAGDSGTGPTLGGRHGWPPPTQRASSSWPRTSTRHTPSTGAPE